MPRHGLKTVAEGAGFLSAHGFGSRCAVLERPCVLQLKVVVGLEGTMGAMVGLGFWEEWCPASVGHLTVTRVICIVTLVHTSDNGRTIVITYDTLIFSIPYTI